MIIPFIFKVVDRGKVKGGAGLLFQDCISSSWIPVIVDSCARVFLSPIIGSDTKMATAATGSVLCKAIIS